jgi:dynein light chain 4
MIKENMDKKYGPTWHVCIGEGFGYEVTHESRQLIYMQYAEKLGVVVFKC